MARPIQYGDPGPKPKTGGIDYWWQENDPWRKAQRESLGSPTNLQFGNILDWLAAPRGPEGVSFIGGGSAYTPPGAGAVGYDPVQEMQYTGLGGGALPPPQVTTTSADQARYAPGVYYPAAPAPGTLPSASQQYPLAAYQARNAPLAAPMVEGGTYPTAGQGEKGPIDYEYIRDMEQWLKETGQTGRTVPTYDDQGNITSIIRRDNQGRILRITRGTPSGHGSSSIGYVQPSKGQRNRYGSFLKTKEQSRYFARREQQRKEEPEPEPEPEPTPRSTYPDWVINMSNWRGI